MTCRKAKKGLRVRAANNSQTPLRRKKAKCTGLSTPSKKRAKYSPKVLRTPTSKMSTADLENYLRSRTPKRRRINRWTQQDKALMYSIFQNQLMGKTPLPSMEICERVAAQYKDQFSVERTGKVIYSWLRCERKRVGDQL